MEKQTKLLLSENGAAILEDSPELDYNRPVHEIVRDSKSRVIEACALFPKCWNCDDVTQLECPFYPYYNKFETFSLRMMSKYLRSLTKSGNSPEPWKDFDISTLVNRIFAEVHELLEAYNNWGRKNQNELAEECIDLANQCLFLWVKLKEKG